MEVMGLASSRVEACLFRYIIEWRRNTYIIPDQVEFHWTESQLSVVYHYFSLIEGECVFGELPSTKLFEDSIDYAKLVVSFMQELKEFFAVPRLNESALAKGIKKYQVVELFFCFLLHLLRYKTDSIDPLKDQIGNLEKELRFVRMVLGDASLQLWEEHQEQVSNLLEEFEVVANKAGSLVHSLFFSSCPVFQKMDDDLSGIFHLIDLLKVNIMKVLDLLPLISRAIPPKTSVVFSLLIINSLLHDLEVLIRREDDRVDLEVLIRREDDRVADVKDQIKMLHQGLAFLQSSIKDIWSPQRSEIRELKELVMRIGDMACEAEYLVISFLVGDAPPAYVIIRLTDVIRKIELIGTDLQDIKKKYEIGALKVGKHFAAELPSQAKTNPTIDTITVGLEDKEIHVLEHLLGGSEHLQIISINGMPGLGKTTFAKKLYNHPSVSYRFDICSFCIISQSYEKKSVLLDILIDLTSEMWNTGQESLAEQLYKHLKGRRYLIVMDDIWDSNVWDDLKRCFPDDKNGSRILITSRNKDVAPPNAIIYELPSLTNDECWNLLEKKMFHNGLCPHELLGIGKNIAANCCGLPLAVVSVAGVLSTMDKEESQWKKVGEDLASSIFDGGDDTVMQILELSYKHLPEHLKWCFLYLGVFSEHKEIPVQEVMRLWIAAGFIITSKEQKKSAEIVAEEYLTELFDRNLAIVSKRRCDGGVKACVIHDLLRALCLRKCEEENFPKFVSWPISPTVLSKSPRLKDDSGRSIFECHQNLRSFHGCSNISSICASNLKLLKVLCCNDRFPTFGEQSFGLEFLTCLRYLRISELPSSIGSLVNLEYLVVVTNQRDVVISVTLKMKKLRYLHVSSSATYDDADWDSSQRNNLESLSTVNIYSLRDEEILKIYPHLRKLKCNCKAFRDAEDRVYRYPDLRFLNQLESLKMIFYDVPRNPETNFPPSIKKLTLIDLRLPWEKIRMVVGRMPKLEVLKLLLTGRLGETWETGDGEFQHLRFLKLQHAYIGQWNVASSEHFPRLQQLVLIDCYYLQKIPSEIGEIASLQLIEVQNSCPKSLVESAEKIQQEQREMGNEELRVIINNVYHGKM